MSDTIHPDLARNLRAVADLLDQHPDLSQPYVTTRSDGTVEAAWFLHHDHADRYDVAHIVREIDGTWDRAEAPWDKELMRWSQRRPGLALEVTISRELVCERRVVGTETVTIPAVEAQPERTETRDVVEWDCKPLLAPEPADLSEAPC